MEKSHSINITKKRILKRIPDFITHLAAVLFLIPFYISVIMAFKTPAETAKSVLSLPKVLHWSNFSAAIEKTNFFRSFLNSTITTSSSVLLIIICASMAGYIISRNLDRTIFKLSELLFLGAMMLPFQVIMIPVYRMMKNIGLLNTLTGAIILMVGTSIPYASFLYIGFVKTVPRELEEAARIDGCGLFRTYWNIVFPMLKPITATVASLHVLWMWNEFNIALIVLQKSEVRTIPMQQFFFFGQYVSNMNQAFASACLSMVPILIFFLATQKSIVQGLSAGALKG